MPEWSSWRYDPSTSEAYPLHDENQGNGEGTLGLLNGTHYLAGYYLYEAGTGRVVDRIGIKGDITISRNDDGQAFIWSESTERSINRTARSRGAFFLAGSVDVVLPNGELRNVPVEFASVSGVGTNIYRYEGSEGAIIYKEFAQNDATLQMMLNNPDYKMRLATAGEARDRALAGYLLRNEEALIQEAASILAEQEGGNASDWFSAALNILLHNSTGKYGFMKMNVVPATGG